MNFVSSQNKPNFTSLVKAQGELAVLNFPKSLFDVERWMSEGGQKKGTVNSKCQEEIKVISTFIHKLLQAISQLHVFVVLSQSHCQAFMPPLWKQITTYCLTAKVKTPTFIFFPSKDKQQQLFRQNSQCTLITVNKQTQD